MTKRLNNRFLIFVSGVVIVLAIAAHQYVVPTIIANRYLGRFYKNLQTANTALIRAAATGNLPQFADPDITLEARIDQTASALAAVAQANGALDTFNQQIQDLPAVPGAGWFGPYQTAAVKRAQGQRLVLQSKEVLEQYRRVLVFIAGYTPLQRNLDARFAPIEQVQDFDTLGGRGPDMAAVAADIRADADVLKGLSVPPEFATLRSEALATFDQAAKGFDHLAYGLDIAVNADIYGAEAEITAASVKNTTTDKNLLISLTDTSAIFLRLTELPEKTDYVER